jgi:hypothetical protein
LRSSLAEVSPEQPFQKEITPSLRLLMWAAVILLGLLQCWAHRNDMNPDGISYIEMAEGAASGDWHSLVNGYWSPLYPFLISVALHIFHPPPEWEFTLVHGVNLLIYLVGFACFQVFLKELIRAHEPTEKPANVDFRLSSPILQICSCALFLWMSQYWVTPAWVTPDLCVAGLLYLIIAILLQIHRGQKSWVSFVFLGVALGLGYLAKAPMFLMAFVFLACTFMALRTSKRKLTGLILAILFFFIFAIPFIARLSSVKGRFTFGDSGRINYAEFVNRVPKYVYWEGEPPGTGAPVHPPRKIFSSPPLYEFASPIPGSYPLWRDPSYWYEGIRPQFSVKGQLSALYRCASSYFRMISVTAALYVVFVVLVFFLKSSNGWLQGIGGDRFIFIPSFAAFGMYALVHVEPRFVGAFGLMLLMVLLVRVRFPGVQRQERMRRLTFFIVLAPIISIAYSLAVDVKGMDQPKQGEERNVAQGLHKMGISPGREVGYIGKGMEAYWAHLAGVRIVVEIPENGENDYLSLSLISKQEILKRFADVGVVAIVTNSVRIASSTDGWEQIPATRYWLHKTPAFENAKPVFQ